MNLNIDYNINAKTVEEFAAQTEQVFQRLFEALQRQPNFYLNLNPQTPIPRNLPRGTIVFTITGVNTFRVGVWDGQNLNTTN